MVPCGNHPYLFLFRLSTETELLDDLTVSLNVHRLEIIQDLAALTDEAEKGTTGDHVLLVLLHVLGKFFSGIKYSAILQQKLIKG